MLSSNVYTATTDVSKTDTLQFADKRVGMATQ